MSTHKPENRVDGPSIDARIPAERCPMCGGDGAWHQMIAPTPNTFAIRVVRDAPCPICQGHGWRQTEPLSEPGVVLTRARAEQLVHLIDLLLPFVAERSAVVDASDLKELREEVSEQL